MTSVLRRRTLAAIETLLHRRPYSIAAVDAVASRNHGHGGEVKSSDFRVLQWESSLWFQVRSFHAKSEPLNYRASSALQAEYAVDVDSYEDSSKASSNDEGLEIAKLGISPEIISALAKRGITRLFPIQRAVLEPAMQGRDMVGRARTGTGKTLAFGIPILDKIIQFNAKHGRGRNPLALVLAPTRELARQVEKEFQESAPSLDSICVYGGTPISRQMRQLDYGVDITVGTPGRIIDLLNRGALNLSEVQFLVLDEADQMLQVGFQEDVEKILERMPQKRQTMMFSATMPQWIRQLVRNYLNSPVNIDLVGDSDQKLADGISLYSVASDMHGKASIIGPLITEHAKGGKCIVFTQTKRDADRLAYAMARSYRCEALHGDISQSQRERTLSGFREGHFNILVATDVAARGLDIPNVDLVIHYELPNNSEIFVHRSGRTGRAGKKGTAILIYTRDETRAVRVIERDVGCRFTELPKVAGDPNVDMFGDSAGGRFSSFGGMRDRRSDGGFGRFGGPGRSRVGRSDGFGDSARGSKSGSFGSFGDRGRSGGGFGSSFGDRSRSGGGFGSSFGDRGQSGGGFGDSDRFGSAIGGSFGERGRSGSGFGGPSKDRTGNFGGSVGRSGGFGDFGLSD